ncbi:MAG TPA: hypothetical protein VMI53_14860, partial [Opitutaceae bacterium]|nr:hypothetical protein [Opitutaceae bacterium]
HLSSAGARCGRSTRIAGLSRGPPLAGGSIDLHRHFQKRTEINNNFTKMRQTGFQPALEESVANGLLCNACFCRHEFLPASTPSHGEYPGWSFACALEPRGPPRVAFF